MFKFLHQVKRLAILLGLVGGSLIQVWALAVPWFAKRIEGPITFGAQTATSVRDDDYT